MNLLCKWVSAEACSDSPDKEEEEVCKHQKQANAKFRICAVTCCFCCTMTYVCCHCMQCLQDANGETTSVSAELLLLSRQQARLSWH